MVTLQPVDVSWLAQCQEAAWAGVLGAMHCHSHRLPGAHRGSLTLTGGLDLCCWDRLWHSPPQRNHHCTVQVRQWLQPTCCTAESFNCLRWCRDFLFYSGNRWCTSLCFGSVSLHQIYELCITHAPFRVGNYCLSRSCSNSHLHLNNLNETNNRVAEDWIYQWVNIWM